MWQLIISSNLSDNFKVDAYFDFVYNYYQVIKKYKKYTFKNKADKNEIKLFLKTFKQQNFTTKFNVNCIKIALKEVRIKFLIVLLLVHLKVYFLK